MKFTNHAALVCMIAFGLTWTTGGALIACGSDPSAPDTESADAQSPKTDAQSDGGSTPRTFSVGGTVTGLSGTGLVLQNNAGDDIPIAADGSFAFATQIPTGGTFDVAVKTQPTAPSQTCTVSGGKGTVASSNVTSVTVSCATSKYTVGGNVSGLEGTGLILQNGGKDDAAIGGNGTFAFATAIDDQAPYDVAVKTQPTVPSQTCVVTKGSGSVQAANVADVDVACTTNTYKISVNVTGLSGSGLVLQSGGADDMPISVDGTATFTTPVKSGAPFAVTVKSQPTGPAQTCTVNGGTGTVGGADVTTVTVACAIDKHSIGGTVSGLVGSVTLSNGGETITVTDDGTFAFKTTVESGKPYEVAVAAQPTVPSQTCTVSNEKGSVVDADITNVAVVCVTNKFTVGGTVTGLAGNGLVLQDNFGDDLPRAANGSFTFATSVASGAPYSVTVKTQPSNLSQTCSVTNGVGNVGGANITNVSVTCVTRSFTVGGTVSGLVGTGLVLQNNGGADVAIPADGAFTFATPVLSGGSYSVTVKSQPTGPSQTCTVAQAAARSPTETSSPSPSTAPRTATPSAAPSRVWSAADWSSRTTSGRT